MKNIKIRLFISEQAFSTSGENFSELLCLWYDVSPFSFADLAGTIKAKRRKTGYSYRRDDSDEDDDSDDDGEHGDGQAVKMHNSNFKSYQDSLSLVSSMSHDHVGGVSPNAPTDLAGVLKCYYRHLLVDLIGTRRHICSGKHRETRRVFYGRWPDINGINVLDCILDKNETLSGGNFEDRSRKMRQSMKGINGFMSHIENLGHEEIGLVEGLNVELLAFQRQSVQWALERENLPGGLQSLFWPKLPNADAYYNPILKKFRGDKPRVARGGFIAEEMGKRPPYLITYFFVCG